MWSGRRLTRKQLTSRPDHLWPELWKSMGKNAKLKEKQKWSEEKLHLENARKLRGIYFIDPEDTEFKETIKNARKKLETSVAPALPWKIMKNCGNGESNEVKSKLSCISEANESTRLRMGESIPNLHEDHICRKRKQFIAAFGQRTRITWDSVEETSKHGVLGRHQSWSKERIEVLSDTIERHHSSLYSESCSDGNWRSHIREGIRVTSSSSKDFLAWLDERIGFRNCSATRWNPLFSVTQFARKVHEKRAVFRRSKHVLFMKKLLNMIERRHPLFAVTHLTRKVTLKHVPLVKTRTSTLEKKQIMIERVHSLFAVTQVTRKVTSKQCCTRWTLTSECVDCHILLWNKLKTLVFLLNWSRRSRTTVTDILFNSIYNKTKPTTRSVRRQRKYQGRGHCRAVWIVRDGP